MKKTKFFATVVICVFLTSLLFYIFKFYPSGNHSVTVNENTYQDNLKENEEISLSNLLYNHQQSHINKWYNSNKIYNATRLVMFIQNALEESNTFNKETKYISKEEFASKLTDSVIMRTRVATCMSISNNENTLVCGITNQLNGIVGCVAAMASLSQQSKLPEYGGAEIRAMLELEMCTAGSQGMMECTEHSPMSNIFNQTIFNSFVNDRKNWDNLVNIPTLSGGTLQWDEKSVKEVYPPSWKLSSTPPIKIVTDVPFFNGSLNMEIYKKDLLEIRKQQMNDFKGTFVMSKEEYLLMDCVRNVWIDSLKNWSKNKTSDNYRNIWEILYYSNNNNRQQRQRISVNQQYKMIIDILRNNCGSATNRTIDPYIHYYGYPGEFTTLEDKARNFVHLLTPESLDALRGTHFDDEQLLESRRSISKKVMNIGPMFSKWHPIQPYEIQFYLEVLQHLKPLNYIEEQVQSIFNRLYENHDHVVVMHTQFNKKSDGIYVGCMKLPDYFDNEIYPPEETDKAWIDLLTKQLALPKKTAFVLIGYGFHTRGESALPVKRLLEEFGITVFTQDKLFGKTTKENQLVHSLMSRMLALRSDMYVQGSCGTMFGYHIVFERMTQGKLTCVANFVDLTKYTYGIALPHLFNHETEVEIIFPRFHKYFWHNPHIQGPSVIAEKCSYYVQNLYKALLLIYVLK
ncbi:hypothetical protein ABK040_013309 [Willaertia magna]